MAAVKDVDLFLRVSIPQDHGAAVGNAAQQRTLQWRQPQLVDGLQVQQEKVCKFNVLVWWIHHRSTQQQPNLVDSMTKGLAGNISGQTVEDQVPAGGAGGDGAVVGVERHTGHIFFMVLEDRKFLHPCGR